MTTIDVTATRWEGGWELAIGGDPVTQVRTLDRAAQQVRDYLDTAEPDVDHSDVDVRLRADFGDVLADLGERIQQTRAATIEAQQRQVEAARQTRIVVRELRDAHVSVADAAALLGVSRGRVSQLVKEPA